MRYVFILISSLMVGCPSQPSATTDPTGGTGMPKPLVEFENAPSGSSTKTNQSIKVKGANTATKEYAYVFVPRSGVNCSVQSGYSPWLQFSTSITITAAKMGQPGKKTLCAKGRRADKTEQQKPTKREWTLVGDATGLIDGGDPSLEVALDPEEIDEEADSSQDVKVTVTFKDIIDADKSAEVTLTVDCDDDDITNPTVSPKDATNGTATWEAVAVPINKAGECEFKAEATLASKNKNDTATFTINATAEDGGGDGGGAEVEHTLELTEEEKEAEKTTDGLNLSQKTLKFASTSKDGQTVTLENMGAADITWLVTTPYGKEALFEVRKVDAAGDDVNDDSKGEWKEVKTGNLSEITGTLNTSDAKTQVLQFRLARRYKTDYNGDQEVDLHIGDGSKSVTLTLHILAPKLKISADDMSGITKEADAPIWRVVLKNSDKDKEKTLKIKNEKEDLSVLDWDVFPYMYKPDWFDYEKKEGSLILKKLGEEVPEANDNKKITLIIASNSDSHGIRARSFALFNARQEITWEEETETETKKEEAAWRTKDIRYVVVEFKE